MLIEYLSKDPAYFFIIVVAAIVSVTLHELAHGVAAILLGDDTPRELGHMTWNPIVHMGWMSLLLLVLTGMCWGMMPVSPWRLRGRHGHALVAFAGPACNVLLALAALTTIELWEILVVGAGTGYGALAYRFFFYMGILNFALAAFNLLPIPPLDGATVLSGFHAGFRRLVQNPDFAPWGPGALILLVIVMNRTGVGFFTLGKWLTLQYTELWR